MDKKKRKSVRNMLFLNRTNRNGFHDPCRHLAQSKLCDNARIETDTHQDRRVSSRKGIQADTDENLEKVALNASQEVWSVRCLAMHRALWLGLLTHGITPSGTNLFDGVLGKLAMRSTVSVYNLEVFWVRMILDQIPLFRKTTVDECAERQKLWLRVCKLKVL